MPKIYLDTCVWSRPFDKPSPRIDREAEAFFRILEGAHYERKYVIIGSLILEDEVEQIVEEEKSEAVKALMHIFISRRIKAFSRTLQKEIAGSLGLKDKDALHLAFTIRNSEYFITVDHEILRKGKEIEKGYGIKVLNPVEFIEVE